MVNNLSSLIYVIPLIIEKETEICVYHSLVAPIIHPCTLLHIHITTVSAVDRYFEILVMIIQRLSHLGLTCRGLTILKVPKRHL